MRTKIAILGGSGYTALELIRLLLRHPHVEIAAVTTRQESVWVREFHPSLTQRLELRCESFDADALAAKGIECAFGCLPHGASAEAVAPLLERGIRVVDLSADYRLRDASLFEKYYGAPPHDPKNLTHAVYGLPEIYGDQLRSAKLVANPGCYPQTAILGLAPLIADDVIERTGIIVNSISGISGAGRTAKQSSLYCEVNESVSAYNIGMHRHTPEIEQTLGDIGGSRVEVLFAPHLAPMDRGIHSTIYATPKRQVDQATLLARYREYYAGKPFVRVRDNYPATKDAAFTNFLDVHVRVTHGKIVVLASEDNLCRGASGVAVQNFNRMFGYDETTGLV